jgi:broad specificity phosphatase PhoE
MIPFNIKDKYWDNIHPGMMGRIKHRLILVRHGESTSNVELTTTGITTEYAIDHALTDIGKQQANDIANFLESKGIEYINRIEISPLDRTFQTSLPTLTKLPINTLTDVSINFKIREIYSKPSYECNIPFINNYNLPLHIRYTYQDTIITNTAFTKWIREPDIHFQDRVNDVLQYWKHIGSTDNRCQTVVFTHSQFISYLLSGCRTDMSFHVANGSISIIDIDEHNNLHVHASNYTRHLQNPTGLHTSIF